MIDSIDAYYVGKLRHLELVSGAEYMSNEELLVAWGDPSQWWNKCSSLQSDLYIEYRTLKSFIKKMKDTDNGELTGLLIDNLSNNT